MSVKLIGPPQEVFYDDNGTPLDGGYIWIGEANQNPETNPIAIYWDAALTQPAAQPVRTTNGYPSNNGTAGKLYAASEYSITIRDWAKNLVFALRTSASGDVTFPISKADAEALGDTSSIDVLVVWDGTHVWNLEKDAGGTFLTSADGQNWAAVDWPYYPRPVTAPSIVKNVGDWQRRNRDLLDFAPAATPSDWGATLNTAVIETLAAGGELTIPTGAYNTSIPVIIDLQGITGAPASNQRRIRIRGQGQGNTVLRATTDGQNIIRIVGDDPLTTASHGYMDILSNMSFAGNTPTSRTAVGVKVENMAYLRFSSLGFHNLFAGFNGVGVLSSYFDFLNFNESTKGVVLDADASGPHSNLWVGCEFRQLTGVGFDQFSRMSGQTFVNCRVEGCGTQGDSATGGMIFRMSGSAGEAGPTFVGGYIEGNGGGFDISLQENASQRVNASLMGVIFNRINSAKYVTNNIATTGDVDLNLMGCTFTSYNSYTPDAARPYLNLSAGTRVYGLDSCRWEDAVESPTYDTSIPFAGFVEGTLGTSVTGTLPRGWNVTSSVTGVFTVVHNIGHTDYVVNATAATSSSHVVERVVPAINSFQVKTTDLSNSAVDADFAFQLQKLKP